MFAADSMPYGLSSCVNTYVFMSSYEEIYKKRRDGETSMTEALVQTAKLFDRYEGYGLDFTLKIFAVEGRVRPGGELEEGARECLG